MRSPIGPLLVIAALAAVVVLALVVVQLVGLRDDLGTVRAELAAVESQVGEVQEHLASRPDAVTVGELQRDLDGLEASLRDWLIATGNDGFDPDGGGGGSPEPGGVTNEEIAERVDEVLDRIESLEDRLDRICEGVPVC